MGWLAAVHPSYVRSQVRVPLPYGNFYSEKLCGRQHTNGSGLNKNVIYHFQLNQIFEISWQHIFLQK